MKRFIIFHLTAALLFGLCACQPENPPPRQPVNFYYRNTEITYGSDSGVISAQVSEGAGYTDPIDLLNKYLKGPSDSTHDATFPASTKILDMTVQGDTAYLKMNTSLARLTGIDLTIACACITMTTIELTGVTTVTISANGETLDGSDFITMDRSKLMLLDVYTPEATEE